MYCSKCGVKLEDGVKACPACGQAQADSANRPTRTSGKAVASLIFSLVGLFPFLSFIMGILAIVFSALAKSEIGKDKSLTGSGMATAGLVLGIFEFVFIGIGMFAAIAIPNFIAMQSRAREAMVKNQMHEIQLTMENYKDSDRSGQYPTSLDSKLADGRSFRDLLPQNTMLNPFNREPTRINFIDRVEAGIEEAYDKFHPIELPRGEINVYCDGKRYVILGGGRNGEQMGMTLQSDY